MASPSVTARTETAPAAGTSLTLNFAQVTGERVVIFLALSDTAQALSTVGDGFTNLTNTNATFHILTKVLDGSEGGNVVVTVGASTKAASLAYNISGHDADTAPEFSTVATGTSTGPDPGSLTPTGGGKDYLWLAAFRQNGEEADDDTWCNSAPTNYTNLIQKTTGIGGVASTNGSVASAERALTAATEDPGVFNTDQSLAWRAYTVAVYPMPSEPTVRTAREHFFLMLGPAGLRKFVRSLGGTVEAGLISRTASWSLPFDTNRGVSPPASLPLDWTRGGLVASAELPLESSRGVLFTADLPLTSVRGVAATSALPLDVIGFRTISWALPLDVNRGVEVIFGTVPLEINRGVLFSGSLPLTWMRGVAAAAALPLDIIGFRTVTFDLPFESMRTASMAAGLPIDATRGVLFSAGAPLESMRGVLFSAGLPLEAIGFRTTNWSLPLEWMELTLASAQLPLEWLRGGLLATPQLPLEWGRGVLFGASSPLETMRGIAAPSSLPAEWTALRSVPFVLPAEWMRGGILASAQLPLEWLRGGLVAIFVLPWESEQGTLAGVIFTRPFDPLRPTGPARASARSAGFDPPRPIRQIS